MHSSLRRVAFLACVVLFSSFSTLFAQTAGNAGTLNGIVTDASNAVVPHAVVTLSNPVSGFTRNSTTDAGGRYLFSNIPLNPYHLTIIAPGFASVVGIPM